MPAFMVCLLTLREFAEGCNILNLILHSQQSQAQIGKKKLRFFQPKLTMTSWQMTNYHEPYPSRIFCDYILSNKNFYGLIFTWLMGG